MEQFRYTIQERALELPQGGWEMEVENPKSWHAANSRKRWASARPEMTYLGWLWIAYGFARQKQHVFLATGLTHTERDPDPRSTTY